MARNLTEIRSKAREFTDSALETLAHIMRQPNSPPAARVAAAGHLLDRGWGKPAQAIVGGDEDDNPVKLLHKIERLIVSPTDRDGGGIPPAA